MDDPYEEPTAADLPSAPVGHPDPATYFRFRRETMRRTQAFMVIGTIVFCAMELYKPGVIGGLTTVVTGFYTTMSIPTIGYYSNTAITEYMKKRV